MYRLTFQWMHLGQGSHPEALQQAMTLEAVCMHLLVRQRFPYCFSACLPCASLRRMQARKKTFAVQNETKTIICQRNERQVFWNKVLYTNKTGDACRHYPALDK